jgi:hypothetical protein
MSKTWRFTGMLLGVAVLSAGCDKSATSGPGKPGDETYAKKLVGVWEGSPEGEAAALGPLTAEFKADNGFKFTVGSGKEKLEMPGTWKLVKEEGKTVTVETETENPFAGIGGAKDAKGPAKTEKKTFSIVFEDPNTIVMSKVGEKPDPVKLKRKS